MNRNSESHFSLNPTTIDIQRSKFFRPSQHKTTFNAGDLIPIYVDEVLPGDTFSMDMAAAIRMSTPIYPVMDNANVDFYFFFVPNRLVWEHWKQFNGENTESPWTQTVEYEVPQLTSPKGGWFRGSIADYMGIPTGVDNLSVSQLPFRAYVLVWNEWFRDQNLKQPAECPVDDTSVQGVSGGIEGGNYVTDSYKGSLPLKVAKYHDYFTSCLPEPQKGPDVTFGLAGVAPVITSSEEVPQQRYALKFKGTQGASIALGNFPLGVSSSDTSVAYAYQSSVDAGTTASRASLYPSNLFANLADASAVTVNQLRQAFAIQRLYEKDARGGTRYTEIIRSHFGVISPDARQQRPEYLGGTRLPISIDQVLQTSGTTDTSPQGNTAAYSLTNMSQSMFTKSFTEHGFIIGLACVRTEHTYQQGIERFWSRRSRFDYYWPALANIGEQAVLNKEIYATGTATDDQAFGYQEAWADYRYKPSRVSGAFRSNIPDGLDVWHYADFYESQPMLSGEWIDETKVNIDRTLAVQSELEDQFIADFYFACSVVRPMPLYSVPGLIDHH